MKVIFSTRLKELRNENGLTKTQLGKVFHVSRTTIYNWENGNQEPCMQVLMDLSEFFNVSIDYLLGKEL